MQQQEQEITRETFKEIFQQVSTGDWKKLSIDKAFELAESYAEQVFKKRLREAGEGLPTHKEIDDKLAISENAKYNTATDALRALKLGHEIADWFRDKSSSVLAGKNEEMKMKVDYYEDKYERLHINYSSQAKELSEKDKLIKEHSEEIRKLTLPIECYCTCKNQYIITTCHPLPNICDHCRKAIK